jgi:hypothetical protein
MNRIFWVAIIVIIAGLILWPPFLFIILTVLGIGGYIYFIHTHRIIPTYWVWGKNPQSEVNIKWWNDHPSNFQIEYRRNNSSDSWQIAQDSFDNSILETPSKISAPQGSRHFFQIHDLTPNIEYEYHLRNIDTNKIISSRKNSTFYTQPIDFLPFRFAICGDMQIEDSFAIIESILMWKINRENPRFILFMGDHVGKWDRPILWGAFFRLLRRIFNHIPFYSIIGNHCGGDGGFTAQYLYQLCPAEDWNYTWTFGNLYFISLNSLPLLNEEWDKVQQVEIWLQEQLANRPEHAKFTIVNMHVPWIGPPYANDGIVTFYETYLEEHWKPIFEQNKVDIIFSGHKHAYIRDHQNFVTASIHGIRKYSPAHEPDYVVFNGHHYLVVQVEKDQIQIKAKTWDGKIIDTKVIK